MASLNADIADHERTSALRRDLEQLSSDAGAKLLRALGVKGDEAELRTPVLRPLSSSHAVGQLSDRRLQWRHSSPRRSISAPCSRRTSGSPCPKGSSVAKVSPPAASTNSPLIYNFLARWSPALLLSRLLAREGPHNPGQLDTHPLIREYFGEQLRRQQRMHGRNAIGVFIIIIKHSRPLYPILSGRWSRFS
jgi:hypothetical protein